MSEAVNTVFVGRAVTVNKFLKIPDNSFLFLFTCIIN